VTVQELMARLSKMDPASEVMVLDGFNGGGHPRAINLGPVTKVVREEDAEESGDCEELVGVTVVVMAYGCY